MTVKARAALITEIGAPLTLADVDIDDPRGAEVLVDVQASGICHSDLNFIDRDLGFPLPMIVGHEVAGVVVATGPDVTDIAVGDHVVSSTTASCGRCDECASGNPIHCLRPELALRGPDDPPRVTLDGRPVTQFVGLGGFAEKALVHQSQLVVVDRAIPFEPAALLGCAVATGAGSVIRTAAVKPMQSVAVIGCGGVGLNTVQAAALVGARHIVAVDVRDDKLELARTFGATHVVNSSSLNAADEVRRITGGRGVHHAFEMTGLLEPLKAAHEMTGRNGTAYVVGMQHPGTRFDFPVAMTTFTSHQRAVRGILMGGTNFRVDLPYYAELYLQGRFNLDDLVAGTVSLDDVQQGVDRSRTGAVARTVITPQGRVLA